MPDFQSTMINLKTVIPIEDVKAEVRRRWPSCIFVGATHEEPGKVRHCHCVVRFELPVRWGSFLDDWLSVRDPHNYCRPARSWRRSVRYLLHLDNPEKSRIPLSALVSDGIDEDELSEMLGSKKMKILDSLVIAQTKPLDERFRFLVEQRGHMPSEVSAALRCLLDLEKWSESRRGQPSALPGFTDAYAESVARDCDEEDGPTLDDIEQDGIGPFGDIYD